jgi:hypothetical protein
MQMRELELLIFSSNDGKNDELKAPGRAPLVGVLPNVEVTGLRGFLRRSG